MTRRLRGDEGATAVETALVLPLLLLVLGGVLVLGLHATYAALAGHAAEVALRKATLRTSAGYPTAAAVDASVRSLAVSSALGTPSAPVEVDVTSTTARRRQGDRVTVTVTYDVAAIRTAGSWLPLVGPALGGLARIERTVEGRLE